jgi:hypothetical protein
MATITIKVTEGLSILGPVEVTTVEVKRPSKLAAVAEAVAMLLATVQGDIDEVLRQARVIGTALAVAGLEPDPAGGLGVRRDDDDEAAAGEPPADDLGPDGFPEPEPDQPEPERVGIVRGGEHPGTFHMHGAG